MAGSRKGAVLMLVVALLWSALPASACLLIKRATGQSSCCRSVATDCRMHSMSGGSACCDIRGKNPPVAPKTSFLPEISQTISFLSHPTHLESVREPGSVCRFVQGAMPQCTSPGGSSILRT